MNAPKSHLSDKLFMHELNQAEKRAASARQTFSWSLLITLLGIPVYLVVPTSALVMAGITVITLIQVAATEVDLRDMKRKIK